MDLLDESTKPYLLALRICSILSTVTSLSVVIAVGSSQLLRSKTFSVLAGFAALSDFISSLFFSLHFLFLSNDVLCQMQSFLCSWFNLASILWMACLTHFMFALVVRNSRSLEISKYHHFLCWGFPLILSLAPKLIFDIKWGVWPIEYMEPSLPFDVRRVFALGCFYAPTTTSPEWLLKAGPLFPFIFYVIWVLIGCIFMVVEVVWVLFVAAHLYPGDHDLQI